MSSRRAAAVPSPKRVTRHASVSVEEAAEVENVSPARANKQRGRAAAAAAATAGKQKVEKRSRKQEEEEEEEKELVEEEQQQPEEEEEEEHKSSAPSKKKKSKSAAAAITPASSPTASRRRSGTAPISRGEDFDMSLEDDVTSIGEHKSSSSSSAAPSTPQFRRTAGTAAAAGGGGATAGGTPTRQTLSGNIAVAVSPQEEARVLHPDYIKQVMGGSREQLVKALKVS